MQLVRSKGGTFTSGGGKKFFRILKFAEKSMS
jgi:hypothetical protein